MTGDPPTRATCISFYWFPQQYQISHSFRTFPHFSPFPPNLSKVSLMPLYNPLQPQQNNLIYYKVMQSLQQSQDDGISMKVVLLGDGNVGKTSLLISYNTDIFPQEYVPTIFDNYLATIKYNDYHVKMWLWDTAGQEQYKRLRTLSFPNTDVFLICFSLVDPRSFNHALNKWLPEIQEQCPSALKIFVGTKSDLYREEQCMINMRRRPITLPISVMKNKIEATGHRMMMCSALCQDGLPDIFNEAIKLTMRRRFDGRIKKKEDDKKCQLI